MAAITVPETLSTPTVSHWDSPWLNRKFVTGLVMVSAVLLMGLIGPRFWSERLALTASSPLNLPPVFYTDKQFGQSDPNHPLGTDSSGRDILAVIITGAPRSFMVGLIAAGLGMALVLALFAWAGPTRLIRAQVLSLRERGYVRMAKLSGVSSFDIMFKEMLPNMLPYVASSLAGTIAAAILAATSLEALGLGPARIPTLGMTIYYAISSSAVLRGMWWWWGFPIIVLVVIFGGLFLMAIGLDEIANPRLRGAAAEA